MIVVSAEEHLTAVRCYGCPLSPDSPRLGNLYTIEGAKLKLIQIKLPRGIPVGAVDEPIVILRERG